MAAIDDWLKGYFYWRGQYSVRNNVCIDLARAYFSRQDEMAANSGDPQAWLDFLGQNWSSCPDTYKMKVGDSALVSLEEFKELYNMSIVIKKKFPYATLVFNSGYAILNSIVEGNFPPRIGHQKENDYLTPGMRARSVYQKGKSNEGFELLAIDCSAETSAILAEVRMIVDKIKNTNLVANIKYVRPNPEDVYALKEEVTAKGSAYRIVSDESRAIGLMLFDEVFFSGGSDANAIREVRKELAENGPKNFGKADSSDRQFQRWLANTRKCIEAAEVLEI